MSCFLLRFFRPSDHIHIEYDDAWRGKAKRYRAFYGELDINIDGSVWHCLAEHITTATTNPQISAVHQKSFLEPTLVTRLERYAGNVYLGVLLYYFHISNNVLLLFNFRTPFPSPLRFYSTLHKVHSTDNFASNGICVLYAMYIARPFSVQ